MDLVSFLKPDPVFSWRSDLDKISRALVGSCLFLKIYKNALPGGSELLACCRPCPCPSVPSFTFKALFYKNGEEGMIFGMIITYTFVKSRIRLVKPFWTYSNSWIYRLTKVWKLSERDNQILLIQLRLPIGNTLSVQLKNNQ